MRLYTFSPALGRPRIGVECGGQLVDLVAGHEALLAVRESEREGIRMPGDMLALIRMGPPGVQAVRSVLQFASNRPALPIGLELFHPIETVTLFAPIPRPGKILCRRREGPRPWEGWASKLPSSTVGHGAPISLPHGFGNPTFRPAIAAVMGVLEKTAAGALQIFGYTLLLDVRATAMDGVDAGLIEESARTFCPMGPCIVTSDEFKPGGEFSALITHDEKPPHTPRRSPQADLLELATALQPFIQIVPGDVIAALDGPPEPLGLGSTVSIQSAPLGTLAHSVKAE